MNFLLDTHVLIWYIDGDERLGERVITVIENKENMVYVSKASLWEIAIKISIGKLGISIPFDDLENLLKVHDFSILDYNFMSLKELITLPFHHSDPFDRLIISQAITGDFTIITHDRAFDDYAVTILK